MYYINSFGLFLFALSESALAMPTKDLTGVLQSAQSTLTSTVLPLVGTLGLIMAGFSFFMGSQNARSHLTLAIIGAFVGFGAEAIIQFIRSIVR